MPASLPPLLTPHASDVTRSSGGAPLFPTRRKVLLSGVGAALAATRSSPTLGDDLALDAAGPAVLDDASGMDATPVARNVVLRSGRKGAMVERLRLELKEAAAAGRPVAMGVARHTMGGQSLARGGTAFTFDTPACEPHVSEKLYRARVGTRWRDVIATLDPLGFSPAVMQSNNDFGVASTLSVNAHGWAVPRPPFGSTVQSFRLMLADGSIVACSRTENSELFRHVMGGYGLFGIILDLDVAMVPNVFLAPTFERVSSITFGARFPAVCTDPAVTMAYGRLDVSRERFLENALLVSFRERAASGQNLPAARQGFGVMNYLAREIYRSEVGSDWAKRFRWFMENSVGPEVESAAVTRNTLFDEPTSWLAETNPNRTDILHEYFVPAESFSSFLDACRTVILKSGHDLLNVTLRFVAADEDSILAYAPAPRIAAVMSFSQPRTENADAAMRRMTRELIEHVLAIGGSFYLPYRLHARRDQVARAYPQVPSFVAVKRQHDPGRLFRNALWDAWLDDGTSPGNEK
jgi:FAD/FMN-containing dehydrogenase